MQRFDGKIVFVTGGGSGIGRAAAQRLASEGARVIVGDLDDESGRIVAKEVEGYAVPLDVTDDAGVRHVFTACAEEIGPIDVLVNNAGGGRFSMFCDTDPQAWDREVAVNLRGTMSCTQAVLPQMLQRRAGSIVNVASAAGLVGTVGGATYSAAKAGVIGFTKAIAREAAGRGVRCNSVAPGPVDTSLLDVMIEEFGSVGEAVRQGMIDATLLKRLASPDEIAASIAFLASDDASYVTGHTLSVSGGAAL